MMRRKKISGGSPSSASDSNPPEPSGVFQGETSLAGIEDLSSGSDDQGVPFILVDSAVVYTRSDLDAALTLVEKRRMDTVEADSAANHMLLLEDESPPPELDLPINLGSRDAADLKAAEDEKRFQEDLKSLCLTTFSRKEKNALITTVSISTENLNRSKAPESFVKESRLLTQTCTNLEQIRLKLEQLKKQQDAIMVAEAVPEPPKGRPSIRRQATFDIKRESGGAASRHTISHPVIGVNAKDSLKNTQPQNSTKTPISIDTPSSRSSGSPMPSPLGFQQIINQIGDLLMQLQLQQEDTHTLEDGSSYSYMVTMVPRGSVAKCSVQVITDLKLPYRKAVVQPQGRSISSQLPTSRTPIINIYSPSGTRLESSQLPLRSQASQLSVKAPKLECSVLPFSHAIPSSPPEAAPCRIKSPYMRKRPGTYLKVPAPARLCHGKKRD